MNPFFNVERRPLFTEFAGKTIRSNNDALINTDTKEIIGEVGRSYKVITNSEVATLFDEAFDGVPVHEVYDHLDNNGSRWRREIVLDGDDYTFLVGNDDACKMKVSVFNGYSGKNAVGFNISGWRQVCSNGMFGWAKLLTVSLPHVKSGIVEHIRKSFNKKLAIFNTKSALWQEWAKIEFTQRDYDLFIDTREYLSNKMKEKYKGLYEPITNRFNQDETKWGAYNVFTAIAQHHTQARKGSHVFSEAYKRAEKLALDFGNFDITKHRDEKVQVVALTT
jgi:hypothetical protein